MRRMLLAILPWVLCLTTLLAVGCPSSGERRSNDDDVTDDDDDDTETDDDDASDDDDSPPAPGVLLLSADLSDFGLLAAGDSASTDINFENVGGSSVVAQLTLSDISGAWQIPGSTVNVAPDTTESRALTFNAPDAAGIYTLSITAAHDGANPSPQEVVFSAESEGDGTGDDDDATSPPTFDCALAPMTAPSEAIIPGARGYHGLAFDDLGFIVGSDGSSLIKSDYAGSWSVFLPGTGAAQQMVYLPDGDLAYATGAGVMRATPAGGITTLASGLNLYGLAMGPDGLLWGAGNSGVYRIDQDTGASTFLFMLSGDTPHSLGFSPAGDTLYIGTIGSGTVYSVGINAGGNVVGSPSAFAIGVGGGWHDGVGVDACGYLYVPDYWDSKLFRINPTTGVSNVFMDWSPTFGAYGHGAVFGNGIGGWSEYNLYVPLPYNGNLVKEVVIGVPRKEWDGVVINAP
ncbi:MAG: hypothetical protein KDA24_11140 [Deltaproteobacteria bacterium]|nr:hypothetical protein [Deltaproteobacteria bacterium]